MLRLLILLGLGCFFLGSQLFWFHRLDKIASHFIPSKLVRTFLAAAGAALYITLFTYNVLWAPHHSSSTDLTIKAALLQAPFRWWIFSSLLGFGVVLLFGFAKLPFSLASALRKKFRSKVPPAPSGANLLTRREFFANTATGVGSLPFAACAYGFLIGRLNFEKTFVRIKLKRLPRSFEGLRIAQLSDFHIGPFMGSREIRKVVGMTNKLNVDLIVLTGDFVTWDASTQGVVVEALSGLKAPYGIYGCLGNHEKWTHTQASITRLFAAQGVKILRQEQAAIKAGGEKLNLIGVDFESQSRMRHHREGYVRRYLEGVDRLIDPETANILLSHNPNTFDRAAELGIDLSISGHTHGGQVSLEFISPDLSPARLMTLYVEGYFKKPGGQLYVNRGIGTIGVPIRFDAPPEITVFELTRGL